MPEVDFAGTIDADNDLIGTLYKPAYAVFGHILPSHHIVTGQGALCEYVAVSPSWITRKPDRLSFGQAAALPTVGVSACKLLKHVPQHAKVFVNGGSGGVGTILLQLLKSVKNATVVSTASEQSADLVRNHLKADETVDYRTVGPLGPHLAKHYGRSFDVCFDLVGDAQLYKASPSYIKSSGIYVAFGGGLEATSFFYLLKWLLATVLTGYWPKWLGEQRAADSLIMS